MSDGGFRDLRYLRPKSAALIVFSVLLLGAPSLAEDSPRVSAFQPTVFQMPVLREGEQRVLAYLRSGQSSEALQVLASLIAAFPDFPELHFVRAVIFARSGKQDDALSSLLRAAHLGFSDKARILAERSFNQVKQSDGFDELLNIVEENSPSRTEITMPEATLVRDGIALVSAKNTSLEPQTNTLQAQFKFRSRLFSDPKVLINNSPVSKRLNDLYRSGKAAGNVGDLYDNRDRKHSSIVARRFPQVAFVEYDPQAKALNQDYAFNDKIFFSAPTIGNASLGEKGLWSIVKSALTNHRTVALAYLQYRTDHLYVYPSVRDYAWPEYKTDNFAANTPFVLISKGKSGSDRPFLEAAFIALAALPPQVKDFAKENGLIAPTVQMLLRRSQSQIVTVEDYLGPKAHPVVFYGEKLDTSRIVDLAQSLTLENLPPRVEFTVVNESAPQTADGSSDVLFTTPGAVARVVSAEGGRKSMTVSLANTRVRENARIKYHWRVVEGDPSLITITPKNEKNSVAELSFQWHPRKASLSNPEVQTDRADVAMFVEVDGMVSAPAMVSIYFPKQ